MNNTAKARPRSATVGHRLGRRRFLKAATSAAAGVSALVAMPAIVRGQEKTLRFWSTQRGTTQRAAYKNIIGRFEAQNPQYKVNLEFFGPEQTWEKLTAGFAAREVPDLISHLPAPPIIQLDGEGLVEPFDDVINAVGKDDFFPRAIDVYRNRAKGYYSAATVVNQTPTNLWLRTDLFAQAGLKAPQTWDDFLKASKALTKDGAYGTVFPMGKTDAGTIMAIICVWLAGGRVVNPDLSVAFNSPETVTALEFAKDIFPYSPPGSASYGYEPALNSFVAGRVATTPYTGRIIQSIQEQNPALADSFTVVPYPPRAGVTPAATSVTSFSNLFIPKGGKNLEGAKLFARHLYRKDNYVEFLHAVPGHNLPVLKSVAQSNEFLDHPLLQKYRREVDVMVANMATGRELLQETDEHQYNPKAGEIYSTKVLPEIFQDVLVGGMSPKEAAARGADRIAKIMKG